VLLLLGVHGPTFAQSDMNFTVGEIRVEGLQRVSEGTVYNYLPVNIGDRLDNQRVREAIRALYTTGFFRDVEMRRDGATLIVVVVERPSIESFEITGNKDIKTEDLEKSLRNVGLATGKTFDRSVLEDVQQFLTDQYYARGKYGVVIKTTVEDQPGNRVKIKIAINEGERARIRQINVVGNTQFTDEELIDSFELQTPNWLSWYKSDDRYSKEALQGDIEKLRSYYQDRGYANMRIESTQVAISPEKDDIYITLNIEEGEVYRISDVKLAGNFVVPEGVLRSYVYVQPGMIFSRRWVTATQELLQTRLGEDGYAFAKIDPVPTPNEATKEISLTFFIDPGNRVYVRNIRFEGVEKTSDVVFRREMRQLEGAWLSNALVERSKQRIQRLPYVKEVEFETVPVPGAPDMVDVEFRIEEGPSATLGGGIGYSESQGIILNGNYADSNAFGSGERVSLDLNIGQYSKLYGVSWTDPYRTVDGVARTISFSYRDVTQFVSDASDFSSKTLTAGLNYSYPITEFQAISFGTALSRNALLVSQLNSAIQAQQWVQDNGNPYTIVINPDTPLAYDVYGSDFDTIEVIGGWSFDSRNRTLFPTRGMRHSVSVSWAVPPSEVEYYVARYDYTQYVPLYGPFTLALSADLAFGLDIGKTTALPPYRQFFAGGPDSVRGFVAGTLGPRDQFGNPFGGNLQAIGRAEVILPLPAKFQQAARLSLFYDIGSVFSTSDRFAFYGPDQVTPVDYDFKYDKLKQSTGVAVQWLAPLGLFRFSYAFPLNAYTQTNPFIWPDETEAFQFSVGQAF
jgi:outer membrane protein insertion porin family